VTCVSGVTGANLKRRIEETMTHRAAHNLTNWKRAVLAAGGLAAVVGSIAIGVLFAPAGRAQSRPTFEVASVKPSNSDASSSGIHTGHGRLDGNNVTLKRCIMGAYGVGPHQVFGGPDWMESDRFEITAKADQPTGGDDVLMLMLQSLLAERFHLVVRRETRTIPALVLEVAKNGPKLEKAEAGEAGTNTSTSNTGRFIDAHNISMDLFAKVLARQMELPVVNGTGLEGVFNFKLQWSPQSQAVEGVSIFTAIQEQLGLRLHSRKAPVEILVIEHVEKPSEN
jgi:bla regulator protein blaR1